MLRRALALALSLLAAGCTATVEVQTTPMSVAVPITSIGVSSYAEIAVDIPAHSQGDVTIERLVGTGQVANPSGATTLSFSLRVSTTGTAIPGSPVLYTQATAPSYFATAAVLVPETAFPPGSTTPLHVASPALVEAVRQPRIYLIAGNTAPLLGLGDVLPLELDLNDVTFDVLATKGLGGLGGAQELIGL
jgi:hypothetical protein